MSVLWRRLVPTFLLVAIVPVGLVACGTQQTAATPKMANQPGKQQPSQSGSASKPVTPAGQLALAARLVKVQPVHVSYDITDSLGNVDVRATMAADPHNRESDSTTQVTIRGFSHARSVSVVSRAIAIGNHVWYEATPPGGAWHKSTRHPQPPLPLSQLLPYVVDVHSITGKPIRGHLVKGIRFTLDKQGIRLMETMASGVQVSPQRQVITSAVFLVWVGARNHHLRALHLTEHCVSGGHPYQVFETATYYEWGRGLNLSKPA